MVTISVPNSGWRIINSLLDRIELRSSYITKIRHVLRDPYNHKYVPTYYTCTYACTHASNTNSHTHTHTQKHFMFWVFTLCMQPYHRLSFQNTLYAYFVLTPCMYCVHSKRNINLTYTKLLYFSYWKYGRKRYVNITY